MKTILIVSTIGGLIAQPFGSFRAQDVGPSAIVGVANGCRPEAAFGFSMDDPYNGGRNLQLRETAAPFRTIEVIATARSKKLVSVDLWAYASDDAGTVEQRREGATQQLDELDTLVESSGRFANRRLDDETETVIYSVPAEAPKSQLQMGLSKLGVSVIVSCFDEGRRQPAMDEFLGRTRVERPVKPMLPTPVRSNIEDCADPVRAEEIYDNFELGGSYDVMNVARSFQEYSEHLAQWHGQILMDKGVWSQADRDAFQISMLDDQAILRGFERQLSRVQSMLELTLEIPEKREAGDAVGSCRAVVGLIDLLADMDRENEAQWALSTARYQAEASRLGVTLEE
ncbi:hypothetical protein [Brevundimonas sp.]